jgi:hypothetical protein
MCLALGIVAPQVEAVVRFSASIWVFILVWIVCLWAVQRSLESSCNPKIRTTGSGSTTLP